MTTAEHIEYVIQTLTNTENADGLAWIDLQFESFATQELAREALRLWTEHPTRTGRVVRRITTTAVVTYDEPCG